MLVCFIKLTFLLTDRSNKVLGDRINLRWHLVRSKEYPRNLD